MIIAHGNQKIWGNHVISDKKLFCLPGLSEGCCSITTLETMNCGLPIDGSNVGGLSKLIIDGFNGHFCEL